MSRSPSRPRLPVWNIILSQRDLPSPPHPTTTLMPKSWRRSRQSFSNARRRVLSADPTAYWALCSTWSAGRTGHGGPAGITVSSTWLLCEMLIHYRTWWTSPPGSLGAIFCISGYSLVEQAHRQLINALQLPVRRQSGSTSSMGPPRTLSCTQGGW